jgi:hypothetical protein
MAKQKSEWVLVEVVIGEILMKSKIISFFKKKKEKEDLYETCLICKTKTHIRKDQPIEERYGYV